jgi:hypothetical protein
MRQILMDFWLLWSCTYRPRADRTRTCPPMSSCFLWVAVISTEIIFYSSHLHLKASLFLSCTVCTCAMLRIHLGDESYHNSHNSLYAQAREGGSLDWSAPSSLSWWYLSHTTAIKTVTVWSDQNFFPLNLKIIYFFLNFKCSFFLVRA